MFGLCELKIPLRICTLIILPTSYCLSLPVGSFIILTQPTQTTVHMCSSVAAGIHRL